MKPEEQRYYAHKTARGCYLHATNKKGFLQYYRSTDPVVEVRIRERTDSDTLPWYWGWVWADKPDRYDMVWPSRVQFEACFQYSSDVAVTKGRGHVVLLVIEEVTE
mgnify:CR=1 FL=1